MEFEEIGQTIYSSTKQVLYRELESIEKTSCELFDNISKACSSKTFKPEQSTQVDKLVEKLLEQDSDLQETLQKAIKQLEQHKLVKQLQEEIKKKDQELSLFHSQLKEAENILATALHQAKKKLLTAEQAKSSSVSCEELIKFAFRISSGNSVEAPPGWVPGDPRRPYPLDIEMRCGALGQSIQRNVLEPAIKEEFIENTKIDENKKLYLDKDEDERFGNGGIWQGLSGDMDNLSTMPPSTLSSVNGPSNAEEIEFMSTSSDSSSSGESN
uniref:Mediator of RNA polymerase II transcription subunit 4 n=1 Tax=Hydra vulgaris TaxID=6087 RepID=T2M5F5_HYDVU